MQHTFEENFLGLHVSSFKGVVQMSFKNPDPRGRIYNS